MTRADIGATYGDAVDAIYASVEAPARWVEALQAIAAVTGDVGAIFIYPREDGSMATVVTPGLEAVQAKFESSEWSGRDLRYERAVERGFVDSGACCTDRDLVSDEEVATHPYYAELLLPHGLKWFAGMNVSPAPGAPAAISVQRGFDRPPFADDEVATIGRLGAHVRSALRLATRLAAAEREGRASELSAALDPARARDLAAMLGRISAG